MTLIEQAYKIVDIRLKKICADECKASQGKRRYLPKPMTYSSIVGELVDLLKELAHPDCTNERAEQIAYKATYGEIQDRFLKSV